jgi:hypothetical protein
LSDLIASRPVISIPEARMIRIQGNEAIAIFYIGLRGYRPHVDVIQKKCFGV